ncbi:MAG: hypothetical protein NTV72_00545 [Candidatus Taylorbacteria bacterium]|nr:hypothetical protein [Candidatus Taylorbacteria bacterium]
MTQAIAHIQNVTNIRMKFIIAILALLIILSGVAYGYCIKSVITNATSMKSAEQKSQSVAMSLSNLEAEYLTAENSITSEVALEKGFVSPLNTQFISKKALSPVVGVAHEI